MKKKKKMNKKAFKSLNNVIETDGLIIEGIGAFKLEGYHVVVSVPLDYLKRAVKILETLHEGEKDVCADIAVADDYPFVVGKFDKKTGVMSGVVIAPRVV